MLENFFMTIIYIFPIAWAANVLLKFFIAFKGLLPQTSDKAAKKSFKKRMHLSFLGFILSILLTVFWLLAVWVPNIHFPVFVKIMFFILLIPYGCFLAVMMGLGRAVGAGSGSATSIVNKFMNELKTEFKVKEPKTDNSE